MRKQESSEVQWQMDTPVGTLFAVVSARGLRALSWQRQKAPMLGSLSANELMQKVVTQLHEYFAGHRRTFSIELDVSQGTEFQRAVWNCLSEIPFGQTVSYGQVAERIKKAKAFRAVGNANGKNPVCIVVPCHRVVAADGSIGGFSGGLDRKRKLLALEGCRT